MTDPPNGNLSTTDAFIGASVNISCVDGYTLFGSENIECGENSTWSESVGSCWKGRCHKVLVVNKVPIFKPSYLIIGFHTPQLHATYAYRLPSWDHAFDCGRIISLLCAYNIGSLVQVL